MNLAPIIPSETKDLPLVGHHTLGDLERSNDFTLLWQRSPATSTNAVARPHERPTAVTMTPVVDDPTVHNPKAFVDALTGANFSKLDPTHKGYLTRDDLASYIRNESNPRATKAAASELLIHYDDITKLLDNDSHGAGFTISEQIAQKMLFTEDKFETHGGISEKAIETVGKLFDPNVENKYATAARTGQVIEDSIYAASDTYLTVAGVIATVVDPEPVSKLLMGVGTAEIAGVGALAVRDIFANPASTTLRTAFERRQRMLESWKYFHSRT